MKTKSLFMLSPDNKDSAEIKRRALVEFFLTVQKGSTAGITTEEHKNKREVGGVVASLDNRTILYGHSKQTYHDMDAYKTLRRELYNSVEKLKLVGATIHPLNTPGASDEDSLIRHNGNICVMPFLGDGSYFWAWAPEQQKDYANLELYDYVAQSLAAFAQTGPLHEKHIQEYLEYEGGKLEFLCYDVRNTSRVFCVISADPSVSDTSELEDSEIDVFVFSNKDSQMFGNATVIMSGISKGDTEYTYLASLADVEPLRLGQNKIYSISRTGMISFTSTKKQSITKGAS